MKLNNLKIGFALTGSFCTFSKTIPKIKELVDEGANVLPIMSFNAYEMDTKFGKAHDFIAQVEDITGNKIIHTIQGAEPIGPKKMTDVMVIAPATGNTIAKLANGITDTPVTMAAKSHLRNENPLIIAVSTNDALSGSASNIGTLLNGRNYYFVPFRQDNPITKPRSLVFDEGYILKTIEYALNGEQIEPIILCYFFYYCKSFFIFFTSFSSSFSIFSAFPTLDMIEISSNIEINSTIIITIPATLKNKANESNGLNSITVPSNPVIIDIVSIIPQ